MEDQKSDPHPLCSIMVTVAIEALMEMGGSSVQNIKRYIATNYNVDIEKLKPHLKRALKTAVSDGTLIQVSGKGAIGKFKLGDSTDNKKTKAKKPKATAAVRRTPVRQKSTAKEDAKLAILLEAMKDVNKSKDKIETKPVIKVEKEPAKKAVDNASKPEEEVIEKPANTVVKETDFIPKKAIDNASKPEEEVIEKPANTVVKETDFIPILLNMIPMPLRIKYKMLYIVFKLLHGMTPLYLRKRFARFCPNRLLRKAVLTLLESPVLSQTVNFGVNSFAEAAPAVWNDLPEEVRSMKSMDSFEPALKKYIYAKDYDQALTTSNA